MSGVSFTVHKIMASIVDDEERWATILTPPEDKSRWTPDEAAKPPRTRSTRRTGQTWRVLRPPNQLPKKTIFFNSPGGTMMYGHWAVRARRAAVRFVLCAVTAIVATLGGVTPAAASEDFHVTYDSEIGTTSRNSYWVDIKGTVTRNGDQYELTAVVKSRCYRNSGASQEWGMAFGSSAESWRYVTRPCNDTHPYSQETITETGPLRPDGRVYIQAGAYGGDPFGTWGWGTQRSVWV